MAAQASDVPPALKWADHPHTRYVRAVEKVNHQKKPQRRVFAIGGRPNSAVFLTAHDQALKRFIPYPKILKVRVQPDAAGVAQLLVHCAPPEHDLLLKFAYDPANTTPGGLEEAKRAAGVICECAAEVGRDVPCQVQDFPLDLFTAAQLKKQEGFLSPGEVFRRATATKQARRAAGVQPPPPPSGSPRGGIPDQGARGGQQPLHFPPPPPDTPHSYSAGPREAGEHGTYEASNGGGFKVELQSLGDGRRRDLGRSPDADDGTPYMGGIAGASPDRMVPVDRTGSSAFALPRRGFASSPGRSRTLSHVGGSPCLAADGIPAGSPLLHEGERSFWTSPHFNPTAMRSSADSPYSVAAFSEPNASPFAVSALSAAVSEEDDYWNRFVQRWEAQGAATQEAL